MSDDAYPWAEIALPTSRLDVVRQWVRDFQLRHPGKEEARDLAEAHNRMFEVGKGPE